MTRKTNPVTMLLGYCARKCLGSNKWKGKACTDSTAALQNVPAAPELPKSQYIRLGPMGHGWTHGWTLYLDQGSCPPRPCSIDNPLLGWWFIIDDIWQLSLASVQQQLHWSEHEKQSRKTAAVVDHRTWIAIFAGRYLPNPPLFFTCSLCLWHLTCSAALR